ncbi:glycosyltransferase family 4 protein [Magnetococcus sp. PR-3]|uniref:glycosyltransferase family 4 protein n=1 Tax=Magnetococcus sp. PR-3 TaxID=3120355 RepID=UPI002FCE2C91
MPKLLVVVERLLPPSEIFILVQAQALKKLGWQVVFATTQRLPSSPVSLNAFEVRVVPTPIATRPSGGIRRLAKVVKTVWWQNPYGVDVQTQHAWQQMVEDVAPDALLVHFAQQAGRLLPLLKRLSQPWGVHYHGVDVHTLGRQWGHRLLLRQLSQYAAGGFCPSYYLMDLLKQWLPSKRHAYLHRITPGVNRHFIQADQQTEPYQLGQTPLKIISVGRLVPVKGYGVTLQALKSLDFPWQWSVIGDGPMRTTLMQQAEELGIEDRIEWLGAKSHAEVCHAMQQAHLFVQSSHATEQGSEEALGLSPLEASAMGLPIVVSTCGGLGETCRHGETGLIYTAGQVDGLTKALVELAHNPATMQKMGAAGRFWVRDAWGDYTQATLLHKHMLGWLAKR